MNYGRGIIYVAFGAAYDRFAAKCAAYSRRYTNIPMCVLTNLKNRDQSWSDVSDVEFKHFDMPQDQNRAIKTSIIDHTPFEKTLYLDCDAVIQRDGIEIAFDIMQDDALLLNIYSRWSGESKVPSIYKRCFNTLSVVYPINVYYGAFCGFTKGNGVQRFFKTWNQYWQDTGKGREMPALAAAVKHSGVTVREVGNRDRIFTWPVNPNAIVQHEYGRYVRNLVGCPEFSSYKPFDFGRQST